MSPASKVKANTRSGARDKQRPAGKHETAPGRKPGARPAQRKAPPAARRSEQSVVKAPRTLEELMRQALVMENEAAQRYADLADAMDTHNNREVAALFRKMADIESRHGAQIMAMMGWTEPPAPSSKPG